MRCTILILCLMLIVVVSSVIACTKDSRNCSESNECCSRYCRNGKCIKFGDAPDDRESRNPCKPNPCQSDENCTLQQVQCIRFPCPPVASCQEK